MNLSESETYVDMTRMELKPHGDLSYPVACYDDIFPDTLIEAHWHTEMEFVLVVEGVLRLYAGSQCYSLKKGTGIFLNANVLHAMETDRGGKKARIHSIVFHPEYIGGKTDSVVWKKYVSPLMENLRCPILLFSPDNDQETLRRIEAAWETNVNELPGFEIKVRNLLSDLIFQFWERQKTSEQPETASANGEPRIKAMLLYIWKHYNQDIRLEGIAKAGAVSKSECGRIFRRAFDVTPMKYVNLYRLQTAAKWLRENDWSISEVGYRCGFGDMGYFSKQFRREYGMTPSEYKSLRIEQT